LHVLACSNSIAWSQLHANGAPGAPPGRNSPAWVKGGSSCFLFGGFVHT
jgi:hypothetical protein